MTKYKLGIIIFLAVVGLIYIFFGQIWGNSRNKRFYNEFNSTSINGRLEYARTGFHASEFKVEGVYRSFVFAPYLNNKLNKKKLFYKIAEKGDSIYKPAFSDTLKLIKDKRVFLYTFQKFE